jgi:hypothetical protein
VNPLLVNAAGYLRVLVPEASVEAARDLLAGAGLLGEPGLAYEGDLDVDALSAEPVDDSTRDFVANTMPERPKSGW